jgi:IPTL-CTERM motif
LKGVVINTGMSFTGQAVPVGPTVNTPTLSVAGIAALVLLVAVVGYVLARKTSLGA